MQYRLLAFVLVLLVGASHSIISADSRVKVEELDFLELPLEALAQVQITVASAFTEDQLTASSSVSLMESKQWQQLGARTPFDVLSHMPSTMIYPSLASAAIAIRGYGQGSSVRGIATLLDGIPLNTLQFGAAQYDKSNLGLYTLDRIEMIRGPGSAIYGSDAFHGVFSSTTYVADGEALASSLDMDHRGYYQLGVKGGALLAAGQQLSLAASGSGQSAQNRGYQYTDPSTAETGNGDYDYRYDTQSLSINLNSEPADPLHHRHWYYGAGLYTNNHKADDFSGTGHLFGGSDQRDREHIDLDSEFDMARAHLGYQWLNGIEAEFKYYYWQTKQDHHLDFSKVALEKLGLSTGLENGIQLTRDNENRRGSIFTLRQSNTEWKTDWVVSISHDKTRIVENRSSLITESGVILKPLQSTGSEGDERSVKGVVFQAKTWLLNDSLALLYGGRIDNYSDIGTEKTPRLGIIYKPDTHSAFKWLFGRAFRAPTAAEKNGVGVADGGSDLDPETIKTHELIYMHQQENWRVESVLFYSEWENAIIRNEGVHQNSGASRASGLEFIAQGRWSRWAANGSVSYTESENRSMAFDYGAFPKVIANADLHYHLSGDNADLTLSNRIYYDVNAGPVVGPGRIEKLNHYWQVDLQWAKNFSKKSRVAVTVYNIFDRENFLPSIWCTENGLETQPLSVQFSWRQRLN